MATMISERATGSDASGPVDYASLIEADRVHGRLYYDQQVFDDEMARIYHRVWVFVGHDSEVAAPGDYIRKRIGQEPVIMSRAEDGSVHLLLNRCRHRGNTVCQEASGNANVFRCAQHGWTYRNDGALIGVPYPKAYDESFTRADYGLVKVPRVASYRGFVFGSMAPDGESLADQLGFTTKYLDRLFDLSPVGEVQLKAGALRHLVRANWKMIVENNAGDGYHVNFVHQSAPGAKDSLVKDDAPDGSGFSTGLRYFGNGNTGLALRHPVPRSARPPGPLNVPARPYGEGVVPMSAETEAKYLKDLGDRVGGIDAARGLVEADNPPMTFIFPNLVLVSYNVRVVEPVGPALSHISHYAASAKGAPEQINAGRLRLHEYAHGPASFIYADDAEVFERNQRGLDSRFQEWNILKRGLHREKIDGDGFLVGGATDETGIRGLWKHYREVMLGAI
jgi:fatty-acyl-CoA synthase